MKLSKSQQKLIDMMKSGGMIELSKRSYNYGQYILKYDGQVQRINAYTVDSLIWKGVLKLKEVQPLFALYTL